MNKSKRFLLVLGLTLLLPATARPAPDQEPQEGWQVYTNANYVLDLALEGGGALGGGYTWAATWGGVVCYNASEQVKFTVLDGLADNYASAVAEDGGGRFWFGTFGGVSVLDDGGTPFDKGDDVWTSSGEFGAPNGSTEFAKVLFGFALNKTLVNSVEPLRIPPCMFTLNGPGTFPGPLVHNHLKTYCSRRTRGR
jgi:hypothetical protein